MGGVVVPEKGNKVVEVVVVGREEGDEVVIGDDGAVVAGRAVVGLSVLERFVVLVVVAVSVAGT